MNALLRKIRGVLGLAAVGGGLGAVIGGTWGFVASLMAGGIQPLADATMWAGVWGVFGATTSASFAVLLTALEGRRSLEDLSVGRAALLGASVGILFPFVVTFLFSGTVLPLTWSVVAPIVTVCGGLGAALTGGLVSVAKSGNRVEGARSPAGLLADD